MSGAKINESCERERERDRITFSPWFCYKMRNWKAINILYDPWPYACTHSGAYNKWLWRPFENWNFRQKLICFVFGYFIIFFFLVLLIFTVGIFKFKSHLQAWQNYIIFLYYHFARIYWQFKWARKNNNKKLKHTIKII